VGPDTLDHDDVFALPFELASVEELFQFHLGEDIFRLSVKEFAGFRRFPPVAAMMAPQDISVLAISPYVALSFFRDRH